MAVKGIGAINDAATSTDAVRSAGQNRNHGFSGVLRSYMEASALDRMFEAASKKYGVSPDLLKAVAKAESDFNPKAVSSAGAEGLMQLMPATAKSLGVTDPFDAEQSIMGGAGYLSGLLKEFGDTQLAVAAYNAGPENVRRYGGIPPFAETRSYVKKVMEYCGGGPSAGFPTDAAEEAGASDFQRYLKDLKLSLGAASDLPDGAAMKIRQYQLERKLLEEMDLSKKDGI